MARVMVLGAGYLQVPLIERAVAAGHYVITVDYLPNNPGHRLAHESRNISTIDADRVVDSARDLRIDAIVTACSDIAVPTVGRVNDALGLRGVTERQAETLCKKHLFREFQARSGLPHPRFLVGSDVDTLSAGARLLGPEVVVKAVDRSGSRGVTRVPAGDAAKVADAVRAAQTVGLSNTTCVEAVIPGIEHGGDAFVSNARVAFICVTAKHLEGSVVRGHTLPSAVPDHVVQSIARELERHVEKVCYRDGPLNFDVMVDDAGIVRVIEMSPRSGGNWIPQLVQHVFGTDLFSATLDASLGITPLLATEDRGVAASSFVLGSPADGILSANLDAREVLDRVEKGVALEFNVEAGDSVHVMRDSGDQIGRVLFEHEPADDFWTLAARIDDVVRPFVLRALASHGPDDRQ